MFEWVSNPIQVLFIAFVTGMICAAVQAGAKTKTGVQATTVIYGAFSLVMAILALIGGPTQDSGNAGSWGFGGIFGLASAFIWGAAFLFAMSIGQTEAGKKNDEDEE